jgi:predicted RNase H-like nuclease
MDGRRLTYGLFSSIAALAHSYVDANRICIDMPIGLPCRDHPVRSCDRLARAALGAGRRSSVFPAPCRHAAHSVSSSAAREANRVELQRSLSAQSLAIRAKIAEVDVLMRSDTRARSVFHEVHPEVCFWGLAGQLPMTHAKKTAAGIDERLRLIRRYAPDVDRLLHGVSSQHARKDVCADDVLDATVAFLTALAPEAAVRRLLGEPGVDELGLPMQMLYAVPCEEHR